MRVATRTQVLLDVVAKMFEDSEIDWPSPCVPSSGAAGPASMSSPLTVKASNSTASLLNCSFTARSNATADTETVFSPRTKAVGGAK